jgi:uncharacterized UBP type Zn finger protein
MRNKTLILIKEEIADLEKLIENKVSLIKSYPDDFALALTKIQYEQRKENLETKLKMIILEDEMAVMSTFTRKAQPKTNYSAKIEAIISI